MDIKRKNKRQKGSLAIEAVISFTVFICFMFTLLTIVKMSMVKITLNTVVTETVKNIATSAYSLSFLMESQNSAQAETDALLDEFKLSESSGDTPVDMLGYALGLDFPASAVAGWPDALMNVVNNLDTIGESVLLNALGDLQGAIGGQMVCGMINTALDDANIPINRDNVTVKFVKFPQADRSYEKIPSDHLADFNIQKEDYTAEDAVIALEYTYNISLGILPDIDVTLRSAGIEHGWLYGGNGVIRNLEEGIDTSVLEEMIYGTDSVYIGSAWTGKKYHKKDCPTLYRGASRISRAAAAERGYTEPCSRCKP